MLGFYWAWKAGRWYKRRYFKKTLYASVSLAPFITSIF